MLQRPIETTPFHRTWPGREMLLPTALDSLRSGRNFLLTLFKALQHHVHLCCYLHSFAFHHYQEAVAVAIHVVIRDRFRARGVLSFKKAYVLCQP